MSRGSVKQEASFSPWPFDFVRESRVQYPAIAPSVLTKHLQTLLRTVQKDDLLLGPLADVVASSFLLDAFPPGMHCEPQ